MRHFDVTTIKRRGDDTCPWRGSFRPDEKKKKKKVSSKGETLTTPVQVN